jgi:hypothetical protein
MSSPLLLLVTLSGLLLFGVSLRGSHGATSFSSVKRIGIPWSQAKRAMDGLVATFVCSLVLSSMGGASIAEARLAGEAKQSTGTTTVSLTRAAIRNEPVAVASRHDRYVPFGYDAPPLFRVSRNREATKPGGGAADDVTLYKGPQKGESTGPLNPKDFPGKFSNQLADGRSYWTLNRELADEYAKLYGTDVIKVTLPRAQYQSMLDVISKAPGAGAFPYQGGPMIEVAIPRWVIPWLNKFGPGPA